MKVLRNGWRLAERLRREAKGQALANVAFDLLNDGWPCYNATGAITVYGPNPHRPAFAAIIRFKKGIITEVSVS